MPFKFPANADASLSIIEFTMGFLYGCNCESAQPPLAEFGVKDGGADGDFLALHKLTEEFPLVLPWLSMMVTSERQVLLWYPNTASRLQ